MPCTVSTLHASNPCKVQCPYTSYCDFVMPYSVSPLFPYKAQASLQSTTFPSSQMLFTSFTRSSSSHKTYHSMSLKSSYIAASKLLSHMSLAFLGKLPVSKISEISIWKKKRNNYKLYTNILTTCLTRQNSVENEPNQIEKKNRCRTR